MAGIVIDNRLDDRCSLCRQKEANEVGSHLAPNFIIHQAYSFDGKKGRDREIVAFEAIHGERRPIYYGRNVSPEAIDADHGGELTEKELEGNVNWLVRDHLFCKDCEKRFGILETAYKNFYENPATRISPRVAYLFWLSVFWRMSVGQMSIIIWNEEELQLREILDKGIKTLKETEESLDDLGDFGYVVWKTEGIKKGFSGIFGTHTTESPYTIILNDLIVMLFSDISDMEWPQKYAGLEITEEMVNTWKKQEVKVNMIDLEGFARVKRFVVDQQYLEGWGPAAESAMKKLFEEDRHNGEAYSNPDFDEILDDAEEEDKYLGLNTDYYKRYLHVMFTLEIKMRAAEREGIKYDPLKDDTMLVYSWDVENYRKDSRELVRMGFDIYLLPMAKRWLLSEKQKKNFKKMTEADEFWDNWVRRIRRDGFRFDDILKDNMRSKGI